MISRVGRVNGTAGVGGAGGRRWIGRVKWNEVGGGDRWEGRVGRVGGRSAGQISDRLMIGLLGCDVTVTGQSRIKFLDGRAVFCVSGIHGMGHMRHDELASKLTGVPYQQKENQLENREKQVEKTKTVTHPKRGQSCVPFAPEQPA